MEIEEKEYKQFLQDLQQYPNYFQMGTQNCGSNFWKKIAKKIEDEKEELLESSDLDQIQNQNLEACASYNLGDVDKAEQIISKVLEHTNSSSINACAMMAILKYRKHEITKAKRHLDRIKELAADPYNIDVAKSELAYAYTRLGAMFYKKAIAAYTEAVERNPKNIIWKFGLALVYRRCLNTSIQAMFPDLQIKTCFNTAKKHLIYVLEKCTDEKDRFFKARSYIELADLHSTANTTDKLCKTDKRKIIDLVNQGVQCLPKNTAVLMKAGLILKHCFKFAEAEELLQKAYDICPTSNICHHLGLIKKNNIIHQHRLTQRNQRYGANKQNQMLDSWRDHSFPPSSAPQQKVNKKSDQQSKCQPSEKGSESLIQIGNSLSCKKRNEHALNVPINVSKQALTELKPILKPDEDITNPTDNDLVEDLAITEPVYQHSFPHVSPYQTTLKQLDSDPIGSPDPKSLKKLIKVQDDDLDPAENPTKYHQESAILDDPSKTIATGGPTILPNDFKTKKDLGETLSKVSLTNTAEDGKEPVNLSESSPSQTSPVHSPWQIKKSQKKKKSGLQNKTVFKMKESQSSPEQPPPVPKMSEDVSSWQTSTIEKSALQNKCVSYMTSLINSPKKETGGPTILPNDFKTKKDLAETLSKVSLTNTAEDGTEPVNLSESSPSQTSPVHSPWQIKKSKKKKKSGLQNKTVFKMKESQSSPSQPPPVPKMSEDVSSWQTSTIEKSALQNKCVSYMTRLINSPKKETYDLELSRKLDTCLDLFRKSAELGQERNLAVYYDWGITLLQMIPTKFDEVMEKFDHILANDRSQFMRYRCYEQYGICKLRMSESQDFDQNSREDYREDAKEMFQNAIRCWAYCQKINLSKHFDDAEGNCNSLKSIRDILFGEDSRHRTKPKRDMASLYYLVNQYGSSLNLYQEVYDELQRTSDTAMDSDVIQGIINNHLKLKKYKGVLDLLALLLCTKEGLQCLEFKTDVLTQMMHYSIDTNDYQLSKSVFNFEKDPNEEVDNDVAIIFNEEDQDSKKTGATLQNWLRTFSNSGLKVIKIIETAPNLPRHQEQIKLICNSKMAIFILANEIPSTELTYLMNTALEARLDNDSF